MLQPADLLVDADPRRALYRRWRAQRFGELIGQDPITTTLRNAVATDRIAHAYLFVGPRGTGKTSTARILAKAINCTNRGDDGEPCDTCPACVSVREGRALDVIEIDAASHGLVEDARDLVMRALTAPAVLRRRVYIIDEVHMLSTHAFNALLKLIEEPPEHVVFIMATTDTHKVPATIISRTQRFDFHRLSEELIAGKLARIAAAEGAEADEGALALLARLADGAMRDGESLLDQVLAYAGAHLTADAVREAVGLADDATISALVDDLVAGEVAGALDRIEALADLGREMGQVAAQAMAEARRRLLRSAADPAAARRLAWLLRSLAEASGSAAREGRARLSLELLAVEGPGGGTTLATIPREAARTQPDSAVLHQPAVEAPRTTTVAKPVASQSPPATAAPPDAHPAPAAPSEVPPARGPLIANGRAAVSIGSTPARLDAADLRARWAEVIDRAPPSVKPLLRECRPTSVDGSRVTLAFPEERGFMRQKAAAKAAAIEQLLRDVLGGNWAIECVASNVELEPLTVREVISATALDPAAAARIEAVLRITGGELIDLPEVR
jgi:DNA polymerase-3 subunit gamma/tau